VLAFWVEAGIYSTIKTMVECNFILEQPPTTWAFGSATVATGFTINPVPAFGLPMDKGDIISNKVFDGFV
jgi:hypothetical protein